MVINLGLSPIFQAFLARAPLGSRAVGLSMLTILGAVPCIHPTHLLHSLCVPALTPDAVKASQRCGLCHRKGS